jgi:type I restriction enzyme, S subunit
MAGDTWKRVRLGDFVTLQRGHDLPDERRRPGNVPILGSFGITGWHDEPRASGPGVTVGRSGASFGVVTYSACDYWPLNTALYVVDFHGNDPRFAYYLLKGFDFQGYNSGSAQPSLNRNFIHPIPIDVPPLREQQAIAHILGTLDDKIGLNRRMSETLEATALALFKSWFIDFDPVRAKKGRGPSLPRHVAELFPNGFRDSELGEIPDGWDLGQFKRTVEHLKEQEDPLASPHVLFHHFSIPAFDEGKWPRAELGSEIKSLKFRVPPGVILLSKLNPEIERVWLVDVMPSNRAVCSTEFLVLRPRPPYTAFYVYCFARSPLFRQQIEALVTGTSKSHQRAQPEAILNLPVILPPASVLSLFDKAVSNSLTRILKAHRESHTLSSLRDALLPKLISGELRVKDAERFVGSAA